MPVHPRDRSARATKDDIIFVKQVPVHPRDRLAWPAKKGDAIFVKQVPLPPRDRLKKKAKILKHPRDKPKDKELARDNVSALAEGKFSFLPDKFLNKTVLYDVSKVDEEKIIDKIIENIPAGMDNDEIYIVHEPGTNAFSLRREDGK